MFPLGYSVVKLLETIIAAIFQGILEWLPVSSEGNLVIYLQGIVGMEATETLQLSIFLHIGTGLAAFIYFRKDLQSLLIMRNKIQKDIFIKLVIITILTGLVGLPIFLYLSFSTFLGEALLGLTGVALILTGSLLKNRGFVGQKDIQKLDWYETLGLGIVQGLSIIPGISRSGITTSFLLFRNYKGSEALRFSFLMSIPASFSAGFGMILIESYIITIESLLSLFLTFIVGYISIGVLLRIAEKTSFQKICIALGGIALLAFIPTLFNI
jgi:undecaprenyl-diphosphatase